MERELHRHRNNRVHLFTRHGVRDSANDMLNLDALDCCAHAGRHLRQRAKTAAFVEELQRIEEGERCLLLQNPRAINNEFTLSEFDELLNPQGNARRLHDRIGARNLFRL